MRRSLSGYITEQASFEGFDRSDLQEKIISEHLLPSVPVLTDSQRWDPVSSHCLSLHRDNSPNLDLKKMALCVPGFTVNNVAFERKMKVDEVASQLRALR